MINLKTEGHLKCPKKVYEGFILTVMAFVFFNCPRIGHTYFWFCSRFQIDYVLSSRKALF